MKHLRMFIVSIVLVTLPTMLHAEVSTKQGMWIGAGVGAAVGAGTGVAWGITSGGCVSGSGSLCSKRDRAILSGLLLGAAGAAVGTGLGYAFTAGSKKKKKVVLMQPTILLDDETTGAGMNVAVIGW